MNTLWFPALFRQLAHPLLKSWLYSQQKSLEWRMQHATQTQQQWLQKLFKENNGTAFAKQFGLSTNTSYSEFASIVPVMEYDEQKIFFKRALQGEADVCTRGIITAFAKSSGTTSDRSKLVPVTKAGMQQNHVRAAIDMIVAYYMQPGANLFSGKMVSVGGHYEHSSINAALTGDISSLLTKDTPWFMQPYREPPKHIAYLKNWNEKIDAYASRIFSQPITTWAGVPSWSLLILKRVLDMAHKKTLSDVWPSFECFFHGGVSISNYRSSLAALFDHPINLRETYTASEGFFAFQPDEREDMWLMTDHGIFYEFIPFKNFQAGERNALPIDGVVPETPYVLVITTNSGLWRYMTGDVVFFTSTHPYYRLVVSGRTSSYINLFGEELMVQNTDLAIQRVCSQLNCTVLEYSVAPMFSKETGCGHHDWLIEFEKSPKSITDFEMILDSSLREINSDYDTKRSSGNLLLPLKINVAPAGTFSRWLASRNKTQAQSKVPRLSPHHHLLDEMLRCA